MHLQLKRNEFQPRNKCMHQNQTHKLTQPSSLPHSPFSQSNEYPMQNSIITITIHMHKHSKPNYFVTKSQNPPTTQHPRQHFLQYPHPKITYSQRPMIQNGSKPPKQTLIPIPSTKYHLDPNTGTNSNNSHKLVTLPKKKKKIENIIQ